MNDAIENGDLQLTLIGTFGLRDPLRNKVQSCVKYAREHAKLNVRLVSGDHKETAKSVAQKAGILLPEEAGATYAVMSGEEFRKMVANDIKVIHPDKEEGQEAPPPTYELSEQATEKFKEIADNLRVLSRATASDKHKLVAGLKAVYGRNVAVTGDGINDVEALKLANVGMVMNSGVTAAKEESSIILTENDFEATLRAVMWGRNIFHNISRFLQFQVTVNVSVLVVIFVGTIVFAHSPLNAVQLLWINLIMDTFAALSLSTEPPLKQVIKGKPYTENMSILTLTVRAQIYLVSLWNIIVMMLVMFCGASLGGLDYERSDDPYGDLPGNIAKRKHFTYIYNTFAFLQLFNMINCRKIGRRDFNVFENFFHNHYFTVLFIFIGFMQYFQTNYTLLNAFTNNEPLQRSEWGSCIAVGSTTLVISAIIKLIPDHWLQKLPMINKGNEDDSSMENNAILGKFNDAATGAPQQPGNGKVADN